MRSSSAAYVAALLVLQSSVVAAQQVESPPSPQVIHRALTPHSAMLGQTVTARVFDRMAHAFTLFLPTIEQHEMQEQMDIQGGGGLYGDDTTFAWGASTLEVVKTQATYITRPAAFGPRIVADEGQQGGLLPISDFYHPRLIPKEAAAAAAEQDNTQTACPYPGGPGWRDDDTGTSDPDEPEPGYVARPPYRSSTTTGAAPLPPRDWIALVERGGGCSFAAKIRVAQALGAKAVVVGDAPSPHWRSPPGGGGDADEGDPGRAGRLLTMFAPGDTSDIRIPSTFVTRPSYLDLRRLIEELAREARERKAECLAKGDCKDEDAHRVKGLEIILGRDDVMWEWPLIDLALMLLLLPSFMTIFTVIIHRIRAARQRRKDRAPEIAVLSLPCLIWRANGQPWEKVEGADAFPITAPGETPSPVAGPSVTRDEEAGPSTSSPRPAPTPGTVPNRAYYSIDECSICLSEFEDGDLVRVLPCRHIFHRDEVDDWLIKVRRTCPICKRDICIPEPPTLPPLLVTPAPSDVGGGTSSVTSSSVLSGVEVAVALPEPAAAESSDEEDASAAATPAQATEGTPLLPVPTTRQA